MHGLARTSSSVPARAFPLSSALGLLGPGWAAVWAGTGMSQKLSRASLSGPSVSPSPSFSSISTQEWGCSKYCESRKGLSWGDFTLDVVVHKACLLKSKYWQVKPYAALGVPSPE